MAQSLVICYLHDYIPLMSIEQSPYSQFRYPGLGKNFSFESKENLPGKNWRTRKKKYTEGDN